MAKITIKTKAYATSYLALLSLSVLGISVQGGAYVMLAITTIALAIVSCATYLSKKQRNH